MRSSARPLLRSSIPLDLLGPDDESAAALSPEAMPTNPVLARLAELYVPDAARVNRALAAGPLEAALVPRAVRPSRPREEVVADLIRQRSSIVVRAEDLPPEGGPGR